MLLPLGNYLAKLAVKILPDQPLPEYDESTMHLAYLTPIQASGKEGGLGVSAIVMDELRQELHRMLTMAQDNVSDSFQAVLDRDVDQLEHVEEREEYIDFLETNEEGSATVSSFFTISGNIERIGDHADNLAGYTRLLSRKDISFSQAAQGEIRSMRDVSLDAVAMLLQPQAGSREWLTGVEEMEQRIDDMTAQYRRSQLVRMKEGSCDQEACIIYSELLTDFERIGDHVLNIAQELTKVQTSLA